MQKPKEQYYVDQRPGYSSISRLLNGTALSVAAGAVVLAVASPAYAVGLNRETPTGGVVAAGAATIDVPVAGTLNVTQSTDRAVIHWDAIQFGS